MMQMTPHKIMASKALEKYSCPLPSPVVEMSRSTIAESDFEKITNLTQNIASARVEAYNETKRVAEGADPFTNRMKCYMPMCESTLVFGDFKRAINIKEFLMSGMCQACQDAFFD